VHAANAAAQHCFAVNAANVEHDDSVALHSFEIVFAALASAVVAPLASAAAAAAGLALACLEAVAFACLEAALSEPASDCYCVLDSY